MFKLMKLPFKEDALEPYISVETINFHYGKHHNAYVNKTNELLLGTQFMNLTLEDVIKQSYNKSEFEMLYNNAGQVYNHNIYWQSVGIGGRLNDEINNKINRDMGGLESVKRELTDKAMSVFGSGWAWLVENDSGVLEVMTTKNGETPLVLGYHPILNIDVWEHAYYLDYKNMRKDYVEAFISNVLKL